MSERRKTESKTMKKIHKTSPLEEGKKGGFKAAVDQKDQKGCYWRPAQKTLSGGRKPFRLM